MADRRATVTRNTLETQITVTVDLDGSGQARFETGVPFLEHMLDQIARHGMLDLNISAKGDLHIDDHHTVEDIGITLGQAIAQAVGDKKGFLRYGDTGDNVAYMGHIGGILLGFFAVKKGWIWKDPIEARVRKKELKTEQRAQEDDVRMDELLAKIHREGMASLSKREKEFLKRMSKR